MYWVREEKILSAAAGMHRFVWDVRYAAPESLVHGYPISAILRDTPIEPRGALALPGRYTVKLKVEGKSYSQPLVLKIDPRVKSGANELAKQFAMQGNAAAGMNESFEALTEVKSTREQAKAAMEKATSAEVRQKLADFDKKVAALEGVAVPGVFGIPLAGKQPEHVSTLNQRFGQVLRIADAADAAPTTQTEAVAADLNSALKEASARWKEMKKTDVAALNQILEREKTQKIDPKRRVEAGPSEDVDGGDEP